MKVQKAQGRQHLERFSAQWGGWIRAHVLMTSVTSSEGGKGAPKAPNPSAHIYLGRGQEHSQAISIFCVQFLSNRAEARTQGS